MLSNGPVRRRPVALVVEDNMLIAFSLVHDLNLIGVDVLGPAMDVKRANRLLDSDEEPSPDVAVLDFDLGKETSKPIIDRLQASGVPCVLATGQGRLAREFGVEVKYVLHKPFEPEMLMQAVQSLLDRRGGGANGNGRAPAGS